MKTKIEKTSALKDSQKRKNKEVFHRVNEFTEKLSKYRELSDNELVKLVQAGEAEPFDELVRRHQVKIHDLCYKMLRNYDDAKDLAQETFLKAYRKINKFAGRSKFSTWLYRIAVNNCLNFIKKQRPTEELFEEITSSGKDDPVQKYKSKKFREMIKRTVAKLPEVQRAVFTLRTLEDLSYQEVSEILRKPVSTIKVNHHLAVKNLRNYLRQKI
ncbi:sigma-70 family RNA polymerase sigma factor [candidate division WOR-3 bacterium]|nr:sigma-70 family RNA polymerase sigma factor [candidate division WOR-3 bacterium]